MRKPMKEEVGATGEEAQANRARGGWGERGRTLKGRTEGGRQVGKPMQEEVSVTGEEAGGSEEGA